ncbi:XdhC family protein [Paenibacillus tarimensis]
MTTHRILSFIESDARPAVLATIVGAEGHAYRKTGASMLFVQYGEPIGHLSPGCLESDLQLRAEHVWRSGIPETAEYDMRLDEDPVWGEAVGCGGKIQVLLEPVRGPLRMMLKEIGRLNEQGCPVWLDRLVSDGGMRYRLLLEARTVADNAYEKSPGTYEPTPFMPQSRLIIFGAGADAKGVSSLAEKVDFRIALGDWRESACTEDDYPNAQLAVGTPEEIVRQLGIGTEDFVLVCSHHFSKDKAFIRAAAAAAPGYLGVMGSSVRIGLLLDGMGRIEGLKAPVGMAIGAEGPEEIAVSIVAELIQERKKRLERYLMGGLSFESSRDLSGGWPEPTNGNAEAFSGVVGWEDVRERGSGAAEPSWHRSAGRSC